GFGGYWGVLGALLHVVNHALSKSLLFMLSGEILLKYQTTDLFRVRGLLRSSPAVGGMFLAGTLALIGLPPFGPFISEFMIFRAGFDRGPRWAALAGVSLLVVVFAGMLTNLNRMLYGDPPEKIAQRDQARWRLAPLAINLGVLVVLGLTLPHPIVRALEQVVSVLGAKI
ncbi:MAG TPA: proton-conducting transporter membrane subunit, partial [Blastocatellia bacterium]|nr:proton-conducting transporter membrane subunit [Blastocatellia bacterium]